MIYFSDFKRGHRIVLSMILKWNKIYLATHNYNVFYQFWRLFWPRPRHLSFYKYFGQMLACLGQN
jgi:hypothetical protein